MCFGWRPTRNNKKVGRLAEDQEINSAGWNWAGVASIWGVAGKEKTQNWWSFILEGFQQTLNLYPKDKNSVDRLVRIFGIQLL